jgi:diacylglycerol O-acyltransferase / wax synthase
MSGWADQLELVPGVRRLRPDDHFMILVETDSSPMHIGALIQLDVPEADMPALAVRLRRQFQQRLAATPLLCRLVESPDRFDSPVWAEVAAADLEAHVVEESDTNLYEAVARLNLQRLDLSRPPFMTHVFTKAGAIYFKLHHAVADGVGFQEVLRRLSDDGELADERTHDADLPPPEIWRALSEAHFASEANRRDQKSADRSAALKTLQTFKADRAQTPVLNLSRPTSQRRNYTAISIPLESFKLSANSMNATVNDLLLACAAWALRDYLIEIDDLPDRPLVVNSARSYRLEQQHGFFGNRIVALHPHLATHIAEPMARLRAIQSSMADEMRRSPYDEALLDMPEKPYGARDRAALFSHRSVDGARVLPGNVTISNVPGPARAFRWCGYRQLHNYPVPIIGSGRFLNITSRRSGPNLDIGVIADADIIPDVGRIAAKFHHAALTYAAMS